MALNLLKKNLLCHYWRTNWERNQHVYCFGLKTKDLTPVKYQLLGSVPMWTHGNLVWDRGDSLVLVIALDHHQRGVTQRSEGVPLFFFYPPDAFWWKSSMTMYATCRGFSGFHCGWKTARSTKERLQRKNFQWLHRLKIHPDSSFSLLTSATAFEWAETAAPSHLGLAT